VKAHARFRPSVQHDSTDDPFAAYEATLVATPDSLERVCDAYEIAEAAGDRHNLTPEQARQIADPIVKAFCLARTRRKLPKPQQRRGD